VSATAGRRVVETGLVTTSSLSRTQAALAAWQRARGTSRVVASVTLFSAVVSFVLCFAVFTAVYGGIDSILENVGATSLALSVIAPLLIAPLVTGQLVTALGIASSVIDELEAAQGELERLAHHDPLTELLNRRGFFGAMAELPRQELSTLVLATADIDRFKSVNDTYGHAAGDEVLKRVALILRSVAGPDAIVARLGGDEFAMCLFGDAVGDVAIRDALDSITVPSLAGLDVVVRCSVGIAQHAPDVSIDATLATADAALYQDKRGDPAHRASEFRRATRD
jgi:diguanylate cyclase (GGDEF)-like protein